MTDAPELKLSHLYVKGPDGVLRGLDEHYDGVKEVERDPYGAWLAIQNLGTERVAMVAAALPRRARRTAHRSTGADDMKEQA